MITVSAVIPAYNEAEAIGATIRSLQNLAEIDEIIVVDDGSQDDTASLARQAGAVVWRLAENRGKGQALAVGCAAARGDLLLLLDADLGDTAIEAAALLEPITSGRADVSVAILPLVGPGGFGLVERLSRWATRRCGDVILAQPLSGQRAMSRRAWQGLGGFAAGFGVETAMNLDICRLGYRLTEVTVAFGHRRTGRDCQGFLHRGRQLIHVLRVLVQYRKCLWGRRK